MLRDAHVPPHHREVWAHRFFLAVGTFVLVPGWIVGRLTGLPLIDPLWPRIVLTTVCASLLTASWLVPADRFIRDRWFIGVPIAGCLWLVYLCYLNRFEELVLLWIIMLNLLTLVSLRRVQTVFAYFAVFFAAIIGVYALLNEASLSPDLFGYYLFSQLFVLGIAAALVQLRRAIHLDAVSSLQLFEQVFNDSPDGLLLLDEENSVIRSNDTWRSLLGDDTARALEAARAALAQGGGGNVELEGGTGRRIHAEVATRNVALPAGRVRLVRIVDVTEHRQMAGRLQESLAHKDTLLKELHHRVKNNLQVVLSLVNLQSMALVDDAARSALQEVKSRIRALALVHEQLYRSSDLVSIDFAAYLERLVEHCRREANGSRETIALDLHEPGVTLHVDRAVACGLMVNELIGHATKGSRDGADGLRITVSLAKPQADVMRLVVSTEGHGASPDGEERPCLAMELVRSLAKQVAATVRPDGSAGPTRAVAVELDPR